MRFSTSEYPLRLFHVPAGEQSTSKKPIHYNEGEERFFEPPSLKKELV